jgi:hypothetical protein
MMQNEVIGKKNDSEINVLKDENLLKNTFINFCFVFAIGGFLPQSSLALDEWPMFKSDAAHSAVNPSDPLLPPLALKWSSSNTVGATNTVAYSSPVVFGGNSYIGAVDGTLYAYSNSPSGSSNTPLWFYKTNANNGVRPLVYSFEAFGRTHCPPPNVFWR